MRLWQRTTSKNESENDISLRLQIGVAEVGANQLGVLLARVTFEAVAGGLAFYLAVGLVFAWIIGFIIHVTSTPYFAQPTNGTEGDRVYVSFTVLTTTGFGDFSAATPVGHALAVIEMLTGQLYLVTIIGLLIGN